MVPPGAAGGSLGTSAAQGLLGQTLPIESFGDLVGRATNQGFGGVTNSIGKIGKSISNLGQSGGFDNLVDSVGQFNDARANLRNTPRNLLKSGINSLTDSRLGELLDFRDIKGSDRKSTDLEQLRAMGGPLSEKLFPHFEGNDISRVLATGFDAQARRRPRLGAR